MQVQWHHRGQDTHGGGGGDVQGLRAGTGDRSKGETGTGGRPRRSLRRASERELGGAERYDEHHAEHHEKHRGEHGGGHGGEHEHHTASTTASIAARGATRWATRPA